MDYLLLLLRFLLFSPPFLFCSPSLLLSLFFCLDSLSLDPATLSSVTRGEDSRALFDRAAGSCREHQEPPNGNDSCPLDRDKDAISPLVRLACLYFVFLCTTRGSASCRV